MRIFCKKTCVLTNEQLLPRKSRKGAEFWLNDAALFRGKYY